MLESHKGSIKKHKTNFIRIENQDSYKELNDEDKNVITRKRIKKKNKSMKGLKKLNLDNIEVKQEEKTQFSLGEIKIAKIHKKATKPLKQINDLNKEEIKINSCPCCGLPTKIKGKLEDYKICDNPDEYTNCGEGVILYFSFFKFCIVVIFIATIGISIFDSIISYYYYSELKIICDKLPSYKNIYEYEDEYEYGDEYEDKHKDESTNFYNCGNDDDYEYVNYVCEIYSKEKRMMPNSEHERFTTLFD